MELNEHLEALRCGLSVTEAVVRNREDCGALPIILDLAKRLSEASITEGEALKQLAGLVADGTIHPRLLGQLGDHPTLVKEVADRLRS